MKSTSVSTPTRYRRAPKIPATLVEKFPEYSPILLQLIANRGLLTNRTTSEELERLLSPDFERGLHDPLLLPGVAEAVKRVAEAVEREERITVYGDYDADGIPGTVLLVETLRRLTPPVDYYVPVREVDGYGLSEGPIEVLAGRGTGLIITVDCGIRSAEAVRQAAKRGMEVIVTDHHQPGKELPGGIVVHPGLPGSRYPNPHLSGAGVAYKLAQALVARFPEKFEPGFLKWQLDLVAISTVADLMPLLGENRVLTHYGLIVLQRTRRPGLRKLYEVAGIDRERITPVTVGYAIAPRLNAPGRLETAEDSLELLLTTDEATARRLALSLQRYNLERQEATGRVYEEAAALIEAAGEAPLHLVSGPWPAGVVGIVAGRLKDHYHRPVVVIGGEGEIRKGSARSIPELDITALLGGCASLLLQYGGHKGAAGITIRADRLADFRSALSAAAEKALAGRDLTPERLIDAALPLEDISMELWQALLRLAPYGVANPEPVFETEAEVVSSRLVGDGNKHLKLRLRPVPKLAHGTGLRDGGRIVEAIGFGLGAREAAPGQRIRAVFRLQHTSWNGSARLELHLIDILEPASEAGSRS